MSKLTSRFIANAELWSVLRDHVTKAKGVRAAVAYFGQNGAKLLPLKKGDAIIVDVSLGAVRQGVTDPRALRTLMQRGVAVFSRASLHAKFIVAGRTLIASSANVSRNSREVLDEAGIITTDPAAVLRAADFFEKLCTEPVGKKYLAQCIKEYRPPRFKAAVERVARKGRSKRITEAHTKAGITVHFEWTLGKKTPVLKLVDKAAKAAAKRGGPDTDRGYKPGTIARSMVGGAASRFVANGQTAVIRPYRKNILAKGEEKVRFDIFSEETQSYVESCYAFASTHLAAELHRQHGYRVRFNDNPKYPQILEIIEEVPLPKAPANDKGSDPA